MIKTRGRWEVRLPGGGILRGMNVTTTLGLYKLVAAAAGSAPAAYSMKFGDLAVIPEPEQSSLSGSVLLTATASAAAQSETLRVDAQPTFGSDVTVREIGVFMDTTMVARFTLPDTPVLTGQVLTATWLLPYEAEN